MQCIRQTKTIVVISLFYGAIQSNLCIVLSCSMLTNFSCVQIIAVFYSLVKALTMTTGADVRDILELAGGDNDSGPISKKDIINSDKVT